MTLSEAIKKITKDDWQHQKDSRKRIQTARRIIQWFGEDTLLTQIDRGMITDYIEYLRHDLENSNATINRKLAVIKRLLNVTMNEWGTIETRPHIPTFKEKKGGHRCYLSDHQFSVILGACDCAIHSTLFLTMWETGMRPSEAMGIQWSDIDTAEKFVRLYDTKNGEDWITPLTDKALESLMSLQILSSDPPFHNVTPSSMRNYWMKGRKALGEQNNPGFTPYALRHTFAKRMLDAGFSTAQVQGMLHHKTILTTESYTQHSGRELLKIRDQLQERT